MKGQWNGYYKYHSKAMQRRVGVEQTYFKIIILISDDNKFSGTVEDDRNTMGAPGIGLIRGEITGDKISFIKQMPFRMTINSKGEATIHPEEDKPIFYTGKISTSRKMIFGNWEFKPGFILKILFPGKWRGTFVMEKIN